jgi:predicted nucleic acid-binding protein
MSDDARRFTIDTNILVYSIDNTAGPRHSLALEILDRAPEQDCWLTLQALSEFFVVVTRKNMVPRAEAAAQITDWLQIFPAAAASNTAVISALRLATAGRASYWDALLIATAAEAECNVVLTEDLQDGATIDSVRIHNPFTGNGLTALTRELLAGS